MRRNISRTTRHAALEFLLPDMETQSREWLGHTTPVEIIYASNAIDATRTPNRVTRLPTACIGMLAARPGRIVYVQGITKGKYDER